MKKLSNDDFEDKIETFLQDVLSSSSDSISDILTLFNQIDNSQNILSDSSTQAYCVGNRTVEVINSSKHLEEAIKSIELTPFISFDTEQKPVFKKGQASHGISIIQLATQSKCYIIQNKQITNLKPLIKLFENPKVIKVGTGIRNDKEVFFKQFKLRLKSTIDLENVFKSLSAKNQIGAKKAALLILDKNLQKSKNMSRSNWENKELTQGQIKYASEDATVVYDVLLKMLEKYPSILEIMPSFFQKNIKLEELSYE